MSRVNLSEGGMSVDELIEILHSQADLGLKHAIISTAKSDDIETLETIGREVIPAVAGF